MTSKDVLHNLIWPAVAGNVAWAFFTVLISDVLVGNGNVTPIVLGRLAALLLLSIYMLILYIKSGAGNGHFFDMLHCISIVLCAIAFQSPAAGKWMSIFLIALFSIATLGHWCGRWIPEDAKKDQKKLKQFLVGLINASGVLLCIFLPCWIGKDNQYNLSISIGVVLILWVWLRNKIYKPGKLISNQVLSFLRLKKRGKKSDGRGEPPVDSTTGE